ncbi:MAG: YafY family transcriptional regulator [Chloroflexota bacterium]|nr:YafY family transcriptional regulator [Chloroflexota bacterium]
MRASRLVNLLLLLQARGGMTGSQLAEELEVSVRTVYRDVEALSEAGVPIYAERGPHGGVRLVDGYRTRLTGLNEDEAHALFLSGLPGPAAELGLGTVVAAARLKVLAALPPELRARASRLTQRFHLDAPGWFRPAEPVPHLERLAAAVWEERRVTVAYRRPDRIVDRPLDPLGIVLKAGIWYLVAATEGQVRSYRVSRVEGVTTTEERFQRPPSFDLVAFWEEAIAAYQESLPQIEAILRVRSSAVDWLGKSMGEPVWATATQQPDPAGEDWVRVMLRVETIDTALADLLRLGSRVEVLEPLSLRQAVIDEARAILTGYASDARQPELPTA